MSYVVTITERTPTEDGSDVNSYHVICDHMSWGGSKKKTVCQVLQDFVLNFGVNIVITITGEESS